MVVVTATLLLLLAGGAAGAAKRTVPPGFYGVDYDREIQWAPASIQARAWATMASSGVESARVIFDWWRAQPDKASPPSFDLTDAVVAHAAAHGVRVLPVVMLAPEWAREVPETEASRPSDAGAYAAYLEALAGRYGPSGSFWAERPDLPRAPIRAWQVWNEPEMEYQWQPHSGWRRDYGALLARSYAALHRADPGATVVMAGLTNYSWVSLRELYRRGHVRGHLDAVALNPYTREPDRLMEIVRRARKVMNANGGRRLPIWITEFGASASRGRIAAPGEEKLQTSDRGLAALVRRAYDLLARARTRLGVARAFWYTWASSYDRRKQSIFDFSGLLKFRDGKLSGRPALSAYRASATAHEGCAKDARGACAPGR
jgi:hypothetical protein